MERYTSTPSLSTVDGRALMGTTARHRPPPSPAITYPMLSQLQIIKYKWRDNKIITQTQ